eukprot:98330_1
MSYNQKGSENNTNNKPPNKSHIKPRGYMAHRTTSVHTGYMAHRSHINSTIPSISSSATLPHQSKPNTSNSEDKRRRSRLRAQRAQRNRNQRIIETFNDSLFTKHELRFDDTQVTISNNGRTITISTFTEFDANDPDAICTSDIMQTRSEFANKLLQFVKVIRNERLDKEPSTS